MGYTKRRNKRCIPKEGMPHAHKACQKKGEYSPYQKNLYTREWEFIYRSFIHHPPKISTHLHFLIKAYDLFLLWIRSLTLQNMRSRLPLHPPYLQIHQKEPLEVGWKRKAHKKALVRNEAHLRNPRDHPRNIQNFFTKII